MPGTIIYRTAIAAEWIDYNGHLRDAFYGLIFSLATDALMDRIGMDAAYRERTHNTLYTLEMHLHFLREVHRDAEAVVSARVLGVDRKRLHLALDLSCAGSEEVAASAEFMLIHVHQGAENKTAPFEPEVQSALAALAALAAEPVSGTLPPGSRRIGLPAPR